MKIGDLLNSKGAILEIVNMKLPLSYSISLSRFAKEVEDIEVAYEETRTKRIKELGEEDGKGNIIIQKDSENYHKFVKEVEEVLDEEVEFKIPSIKVSQLDKDIKISAVSVSQLLDLGLLIDEVEIEDEGE